MKLIYYVARLIAIFIGSRRIMKKVNREKFSSEINKIKDMLGKMMEDENSDYEDILALSIRLDFLLNQLYYASVNENV